MEGGAGDNVDVMVLVEVVAAAILVVIFKSIGNVPLEPNVPGSSGSRYIPISSSVFSSPKVVVVPLILSPPPS